jgi:UPF0755 protein
MDVTEESTNGGVPRPPVHFSFVPSPFFWIASSFIVILVLFLGLLFVPHWSKHLPATLVVERGASASIVAEDLRELDLIRFPRLFSAFLVITGIDHELKPGTYIFPRSPSAFSMMKRLAQGRFGYGVKKVTFPEGTTVEGMASIVERELEIPKNKFLGQAHGKEGYLFPDTYFFVPHTESIEIISVLESEFEEKIKDLISDIERKGKNLSDIVIMASLVERESSNDEEKSVIAGILWKRIDAGMPLQVDATFLYILGKGSSELTTNDLAIDSPYNTYRYTGLPPGPIGNPGLAALRAAIYPEESPYWFYLHDGEGNIHYAKNHDGHVANKQKYLK